MSRSPYENLCKNAFWRSGVSTKDPFSIEGLYRRKFKILRKDRIATAGSCFAQHIARHLKERKFNVLQYEAAPRGMSADVAAKYSFGVYSCRYANIYTTAQLYQLAREAFGDFSPAEPVWEKDGRYYDAQRPSVEPYGYASAKDVMTARKKHLEKVKAMLLDMDVFVFTFGLTEAWIHTESETVYPTAPGTIAGSYDPEIYSFKNYSYNEVLKSFNKFLRYIRRARNHRLRVITTVSPVPLTATASSLHVLSASSYSKSVLRAVCGSLEGQHSRLDYYPSYELITAGFTKGIFFETNLRSVTSQGVANAMRIFLSEHDPQGNENPKSAPPNFPENTTQGAMLEDDIQCEEILLEAFNK